MRMDSKPIHTHPCKHHLHELSIQTDMLFCSKFLFCNCNMYFVYLNLTRFDFSHDKRVTKPATQCDLDLKH